MLFDGTIEVKGLEQRAEEIRKLDTSSPAMHKYLVGIIRKAVGEARKNIVKDAKDALDNDPRQAYKAVRYSVYKQILGGQVNILNGRRRGAPTKYQKPRTLKEGQRGGNRRRRSIDTLRYESYQGADRSFILRFQQSGTVNRETRYGTRGNIRPRGWFGISSTFHMEAAASKIAEMIESALDSEFKLQ